VTADEGELKKIMSVGILMAHGSLANQLRGSVPDTSDMASAIEGGDSDILLSSFPGVFLEVSTPNMISFLRYIQSNSQWSSLLSGEQNARLFLCRGRA
jgi:hypothetical protein